MKKYFIPLVLAVAALTTIFSLFSCGEKTTEPKSVSVNVTNKVYLTNKTLQTNYFQNPSNFYLTNTNLLIVTNNPTFVIISNGASSENNGNHRYLMKMGTMGSKTNEFLFNSDALAGIAFSSFGGNAIYVADYYNHRIQKFNITGPSSYTFAGSWFYGFDENASDEKKFGYHSGANAVATAFYAGVGPGRHFNEIRGVAVDVSSNIYVVDKGNKRVIKYDAYGNYIYEIRSLGSGLVGEFIGIHGIDVDNKSNVYIADYQADCVHILCLSNPTLKGVIVDYNQNGETVGTVSNLYLDEALGSDGMNAPWYDSNVSYGTASDALEGFQNPRGIEVTGDGKYVFVSDGNNYRLKM